MIRDTLPTSPQRLDGDILAQTILVLAITGEVSDSRSAARYLDVEHALVLRAVTKLASAPPLIEITKRDTRTLRIFYQPSSQGQNIPDPLLNAAFSNVKR